MVTSKRTAAVAPVRRSRTPRLGGSRAGLVGTVAAPLIESPSSPGGGNSFLPVSLGFVANAPFVHGATSVVVVVLDDVAVVLVVDELPAPVVVVVDEPQVPAPSHVPPVHAVPAEAYPHAVVQQDAGVPF